MRLVIKAGGTLLDDPASRGAIAQQLVEVARQHELIVVHGGGKQVTRYLEERGVASRFVKGLRVSDAVVIDAVTKVIAGSVNKEFVAAIIAAGELAVGLSGVDGSLAVATQREPELAWVGTPRKTDGRLFDLLVNAGYLPVIACIAGDEQGNIYNVNADEMAASCGMAWRAEKLLFLTDVAGVRSEQGDTICHLCPEAANELIASGVVRGGMEAKLEAAKRALEGGVGEVIIGPAQEPEVCARLLAGEGIGTRVCSAGRAENLAV